MMSTFTVGCSSATPSHSLKRVSGFTASLSYPITVCFRPLYTCAKSLSLLTTAVGSLSTSRNPIRNQWIVKAAAAAEDEEEEEEENEGESEAELGSEAEEDEQPTVSRKKAKLLLKTPKKQRLVLKFIWMEKNIGLGLDQAIPGHGTIPLTPYFFWPRKDAWEELKAALESKPWISQKRTIILLNQATDIINLWQQSGSNI